MPAPVSWQHPLTETPSPDEAVVAGSSHCDRQRQHVHLATAAWLSMMTPRLHAESTTVTTVDSNSDSVLLQLLAACAQPHDLRFGWVQTQSASLHPVVDVAVRRTTVVAALLAGVLTHRLIKYSI